MRFLILLIALCSSSEVLAKKCKIKFDNDLDSSYSMNIATTRTIYFGVKTSRSGCSQFVGVDSAGGSYNQRQLVNAFYNEYLPFQLYNYSLSTILKDMPDANRTDLLYPYETTEKLSSHRFSSVVSVADKFAPAGRYSEKYMFKLYDGVPGNYNPTPVDTRSVEFYYDLDEMIGVSLVRSGAPFDFYDSDLDVDFGTLKEGSTKSFDIVVLSNAGFNLSMYSINDGVMVGTSYGSYAEYAISIDNGPYRSLKGSLGAPLHIMSYNGVTPDGGKRAEGRVRIGNLSNAGAGDYSDTIVVKAATIY